MVQPAATAGGAASQRPPARVNPAWRHPLRLDAQQLRGQSNQSLMHADGQIAAQQWRRRVTEAAARPASTVTGVVPTVTTCTSTGRRHGAMARPARQVFPPKRWPRWMPVRAACPFTPARAAAPWQPIVVVVDDADRQQLLLSALDLLGYTRVQAVGSGTAARQMEQRPPDVVVLGPAGRPGRPRRAVTARTPPEPRRGRGAAGQPGHRAAGAAGHGRADAGDPPRRGAAAALKKQRFTTSGTRRWPASGSAVGRAPTLPTPSARHLAAVSMVCQAARSRTTRFEQVRGAEQQPRNIDAGGIGPAKIDVTPFKALRCR